MRRASALSCYHTPSWKMIEPSAPGAYPERIFTASYVLSIRYLAPLQDTAMICLGFFLKNS